ncbi:helix-turn-helix domain-containing protein [Rhodopseudomonas palustris]|uniref:helix-turn-helix domain-containing protein n=1 Tax=Rhodopseudomonas palustris TaxID=1076 RepID=UPI001FD99331|nr:AraC family transcriptional regulator [Rhodopseudomonas palustris]
MQIAGERVCARHAAGVSSASSMGRCQQPDEVWSGHLRNRERSNFDLKKMAALIRALTAEGGATPGIVSGLRPPAASGGETVLNFRDRSEGRPGPGDPPCTDDDPLVIRLSEALAAAECDSSEFADLYADAIRVVTAVRKLSMQPPAALIEDRKPTGGAVLPKWRLKLVANYVSEHLAEKVTLADMAAAARLSRMHFAALFLRATGLRPHEYLLKRRIAAAQELLQTGDLPIVQVAMQVGFQTQAHFTTVFKRITGHTPAKWRQTMRPHD